MDTQQNFKTLTQFLREENEIISAIYKWLTYMGAGVIAFLKLELMVFLTIFMFLDTLFGLVASWSLNEPIKRRKFAIGMLTKIAVFIIPLVVSILGYVYTIVYDSNYNFGWILDAAIVILLANECLSLLANISTLITGQRVKNIDYVERLLSLIRLIITWLVEKIFGNLEKFKNKE